MIELDDALAGVTHLGVDTAPIIYFVEADPRYDAVVSEVFRWIDTGVFKGKTSVISLLELLVLPMRLGNHHLQNEYRDRLLTSDHFQTLALSADVAVRAADLRARYSLRTPDGLQIASALSAGYEGFLTNDSALRRVTELSVLILGELELSRRCASVGEGR